MQGAENILLEQGVMGAIIVLLLAAVVALWLQNQRRVNEAREDMCARNDALTRIMEDTIKRELELGTKQTERSQELNTTLTLLISLIKEMEEKRERAGSDHGHRS